MEDEEFGALVKRATTPAQLQALAERATTPAQLQALIWQSKKMAERMVDEGSLPKEYDHRTWAPVPKIDPDVIRYIAEFGAIVAQNTDYR